MATPAQHGPRFSKRQLLSKITQDQRPEFEQTIAGGFVNLAQTTIPNPLKTDRKVKHYIIKVRGRITNPAAGAAYRNGPTRVGTPLFALLQQITIFGQHITYGAQTPIQTRGEAMAEMMTMFYPNYRPTWTNAINGGASLIGQALSGAPNATNDFEFVLPIPTYPLGSAEADQVFYGLHAPDWAGNLYMTLSFADCTAIGGTAAQTLTAFGSAVGTATVDIMSVRPLLGKDLMVAISPALTYRIFDPNQITTALNSGAAGPDVILRDLTVGKDTTRILAKVGTSLAGTSAGVTVFGTVSNSIITKTYPALDDHPLTSILQANADLALQDYEAMNNGTQPPDGWRVIDFVIGTGPGAPNLLAAYPSSTLGAARKYQLKSDVATIAANQIGEVHQEMVLGAPKYNG